MITKIRAFAIFDGSGQFWVACPTKSMLEHANNSLGSGKRDKVIEVEIRPITKRRKK